jgi:putative membrane protein
LLSTRSDNFWLRIIYIISVLVSAAVAFLILGPRPDGIEGALDVTILPKVNAIFNGLTGIFLLVGYVLIINKKRQAHKKVMLLSFASSTAFLISYIIYHWFKSGPKEYVGDLHIFYYFILISHIVLAAIIIPLALLTLYRGWNDHIGKHRKIAKITLPLWLYVSVTGVMIYYMLYW